MTIYRHEFAFDIESKLSDEQIENIQDYLRCFNNDDRVAYNRYEIPVELTISNTLGRDTRRERPGWTEVRVNPEPLREIRVGTVSSGEDTSIPY